MNASPDEAMDVSESPLPWPHIVVAQQTMHLPATTAQLWPLLIDTERMNRAIGMSAVDFVPIDTRGTAARYLARTRVAGILMEYEEDPFEWVTEQRFGVVRRMRRGPYGPRFC